MKIIVAIKQVPERDAQIHVASDGRWIDEDDLNYTINEPDAYALEEALQLKEKNGGEVVVVCAGPERVTSTLREALAKGADRAIHIEVDDLGNRDTLGVAQMLVDAVKAERYAFAAESGSSLRFAPVSLSKNSAGSVKSKDSSCGSVICSARTSCRSKRSRRTTGSSSLTSS